DVLLRFGPDQLLPPRLLHLTRVERPSVEALQVGGVQAHWRTLRPPRRGGPGLAVSGQRWAQFRVRGVVLFGPLQVLRGVHGDPQALVAEGEQLPFLGKFWERRLLVVAALRQSLERL